MIRSNLYSALSTPEKNRGKIGLFRILCAGLGGLVLAYSGMTFLVFLIPSDVGQAIIVLYLFTLPAWSLSGVWISLSPTKLSALMRWLLPSLLFAAGILYFFTRT